MHCIVGLGNPGQEYGNTRHNIGFRVIDALTEAHGIPVQRRRFRSLFGKGILGGHQVILVKPQIFMNNSGQSVDLVARFYDLDPSQLLIVYDDMALELGKLRVRPGGSAAGHKGIRDIMDRLRTDQIPRLRLGIGAALSGQDARNYVLSPFKRGEEKIVEDMVAEAVRCVRMVLDDGLEATMNRFN
jgi:PTH1 family peptidyl-tRNA hydrolase